MNQIDKIAQKIEDSNKDLLNRMGSLVDLACVPQSTIDTIVDNMEEYFTTGIVTLEAVRDMMQAGGHDLDELPCDMKVKLEETEKSIDDRVFRYGKIIGELPHLN